MLAADVARGIAVAAFAVTELDYQILLEAVQLPLQPGLVGR